MKRPRIKAAGEGCYHVVRRIAGRRILMEASGKGFQLGMIRVAAVSVVHGSE